jgi:hypothetical protein
MWLDVPPDSHIEGEVDETRRDVRFTVSCERDEFELTFEPATLRRFVGLAEGLLAQVGPVADTGFNVTCTPGREAAALIRVTPDLPALVLNLDPVNVAIQLPTMPDGAHVLARFCRELAREAAKLADELEPAEVPGATPNGQVEPGRPS